LEKRFLSELVQSKQNEDETYVDINILIENLAKLRDDANLNLSVSIKNFRKCCRQNNKVIDTKGENNEDIELVNLFTILDFFRFQHFASEEGINIHTQLSCLTSQKCKDDNIPTHCIFHALSHTGVDDLMKDL